MKCHQTNCTQIRRRPRCWLASLNFPAWQENLRLSARSELYQRVQQSPNGFRLQSLLAEMRVDLRVAASDEERIPSRGPVVVMADSSVWCVGWCYSHRPLTRVRPDVKVLTNFLLADVPELQKHCIFVDPFQTDRSVDSNRRALREALAWLQSGGMLAMFPSGEVSHWQMAAAQVVDPAWNDTAVRLLRKTGATALPVYFCGHNSVGFQLMGMLHPRLRTAFLLQEFLQQEGKTVEVRVGSGISADALEGIRKDRKATEYLRWRTYLLAQRSKPQLLWHTALRSRIAFRLQQPVAAPVPADLLAKEVEMLPADRCLVENGDLAVYLGTEPEIPQLLGEVGRLREITFHGAGEGTGKTSDLDAFDRYYSHILLWHKTKRELVGAYRAGKRRRFWPNAESAEFTPALCSVTTSASFKSSALRWNLGARLCGQSIRGNTRLCYCCGKGSPRWLPDNRRSQCCSARSASATPTTKLPAN